MNRADPAGEDSTPVEHISAVVGALRAPGAEPGMRGVRRTTC